MEVSITIGFTIQYYCFNLPIVEGFAVHVLGCEVTGMTNGSIVVSVVVYFEEDFSVSPEVNTGVSLVLKINHFCIKNWKKIHNPIKGDMPIIEERFWKNRK